LGNQVKILFSTTFGHNPGDEIILAGVQNLIRFGLKQEFESLYYNRNPDLQMGPMRYPRHSIGNYFTDEVDLSLVDRAVLAGSPEFFGAPMTGLYKALASAQAPLLALGVGLGEKHAVLDVDAQNVLKHAKVITRSQETVEFLSRYSIPAQALPCPALFATMFKAETRIEETLQIAQAPGHGWHEVNPDYLVGLNPNAPTLCLHVKEFAYYTKQGFTDLHYAYSAQAALEIIRKYKRVVSTRLHGAIGAMSLGIPATVIGDKDFRIKTCAAQFGGYLPCVGSFEEASRHGVNPGHEMLDEFKWRTWNTWLEKLKEIW
jgi:hypothetical protein